MKKEDSMICKLMKTHTKSLDTLARKIDYNGKYKSLFQDRIKKFKIKLVELEYDIARIEDELETYNNKD